MENRSRHATNIYITGTTSTSSVAVSTPISKGEGSSTS